MDNQEAIRLIRNLPTMCGFTDAYGKPIDSDAYYEAVDMAISALKAQEAKHSNESSITQKALDTISLQPTCNQLATDTISRQAAIDAFDTQTWGLLNVPISKAIRKAAQETIKQLPPAQPKIVRCKECLMHCVCKFEQGLGLDGYCSQAKRRTDEAD